MGNIDRLNTPSYVAEEAGNVTEVIVAPRVILKSQVVYRWELTTAATVQKFSLPTYVLYNTRDLVKWASCTTIKPDSCCRTIHCAVLAICLDHVLVQYVYPTAGSMETLPISQVIRRSAPMRISFASFAILRECTAAFHGSRCKGRDGNHVRVSLPSRLFVL